MKDKWSWLTVDPGLNGTGWAHWRNQHLQEVGIINAASARGSVVDRSRDIGGRVAALAVERYAVVVACEWPAFHGSVAGEMVAKRGDLVKLTFLVGVIAGMVAPKPFMPVEINRWKGQLPKTVVLDRVCDILGEGTMELLGVRSHAVDAVGIGLHLLGRI